MNLITRSTIVGAVALTVSAYALGTRAANPDGSVTLTPSKLYELIEVEQKKSAHQTEILKLLRERITTVDARVGCIAKRTDGKLEKVQSEVTTLHATTIGQIQARILRAESRLDDIERRLSGVQKQITVLHSKKADK